jgi:hypothetical protein
VAAGHRESPHSGALSYPRATGHLSACSAHSRPDHWGAGANTLILGMLKDGRAITLCRCLQRSMSIRAPGFPARMFA